MSFFLITMSRSINSINHLPPDPGLEFQVLAKSDGLTESFSSHNGYPQVLPRLLSEILNLAPLSQLTYWSTLTCALISVVCAIAISRAIADIAGMVVAATVGLAFSASFAAHEGLIGNVWAARWLLLPAACIVASIPTFTQKYWRLTLLLFLATGLSHAYIFIPACGFILHALWRRDRQRTTICLGLTLVGLSVFQALGFLNGPRQFRLYGNYTYYYPWADAGVFWWAIFTLPLVFGLGAVVLLSASRPSPSSDAPFPHFILGIQALLLASVSYLQMGVKSSPAVASVNVSFAALLVALTQSSQLPQLKIFKSLAAVSCSVIVLVLSLRYYFPSDFLTNGLGWSNVVDSALTQCRETNQARITLLVYERGDIVQTEDLTCEMLLDWDQWFFQR